MRTVALIKFDFRYSSDLMKINFIWFFTTDFHCHRLLSVSANYPHTKMSRKKNSVQLHVWNISTKWMFQNLKHLQGHTFKKKNLNLVFSTQKQFYFQNIWFTIVASRSVECNKKKFHQIPSFIDLCPSIFHLCPGIKTESASRVVITICQKSRIKYKMDGMD